MVVVFSPGMERISLFPPKAPSVHIHSDASGSYGCGAVDPAGSYFCLQWPPSWSAVDIAVKQLVPLVLAAVLWGPTWAGCQVLFHVDNMAVVSVVQHLHARDPLLSHFLRCLFLYAAMFQFKFSATHIPGINNTAADALSRGNFSLFHSIFPQVPQQTIPHILHSLFLLQSPDWNCSNWMSLFRRSLRLVLPLHSCSVPFRSPMLLDLLLREQSLPSLSQSWFCVGLWLFYFGKT